MASFSAFKLSTSMEQWIEQSMLKTHLGLRELAKISTDKALVVFSQYFWVAAGLCFCLFVVASKYFGHVAQQITAFLLFVFTYTALSIRAWNQRRFEILKSTLVETKDKSVFYCKCFLVISLFLLLVVSVVNVVFDGEVLKGAGLILAVLAVGIFSLVVGVLIANMFSLFVIFGPALVAITYLWVSICLARSAIFVGSRGLVNFLVFYMILGTVYLAVIAFPEFRDWLGVPMICR